MSEMQLLNFIRPRSRLYQSFGDKPFIDLLMKTHLNESGGLSKQSTSKGEKEHPFDFNMVMVFKNANIHHSTCIETKKESTVGIGFEKESTGKKLNPLCELSFQDVLGDIAEDFWQCGNGYMEVVRKNKKIVGLHHIQAPLVQVVIEDEFATHGHFKICGYGDQLHERRFAEFGDLDDFLKRAKGDADIVGVDPDNTSEVIHFRRSTSLSRWYGFPDWLAATASIELVQCMHQHQFDFFLNRGVPEFLLFLIGQKLMPDDWKKVQDTFQAHIGLQNSYKSSAFNFPYSKEQFQVQVEKLAVESKADGTLFKDMSETLAVNIVSAHRVPPLLAGIQIPGKLGATNELPNALQAFQILVVGPAQHTFATTLDVTLGDSAKNGGLGLGEGAFKLKKITDELNLAEMDTIARMREPLGAGTRDPSKGLKKEDTDEEFGMLLGRALSESVSRYIGNGAH